MHHRRSRSSSLFFCCCCFTSDNNTAERSLFNNVARSNSGPDDEDSVKWWRQGWNSVRRAGEWSESLVEDYVCPKLKHFVRRCRAEGKTIYNSKPARFHYDQVSYELNFDEGSRDFHDSENQGLSKLPNEEGTKIANK